MNCSALFSAVLCMHLRAAMLQFSKGFKQFHSSSGFGVFGRMWKLKALYAFVCCSALFVL